MNHSREHGCSDEACKRECGWRLCSFIIEQARLIWGSPDSGVRAKAVDSRGEPISVELKKFKTTGKDRVET